MILGFVDAFPYLADCILGFAGCIFLLARVLASMSWF